MSEPGFWGGVARLNDWTLGAAALAYAAGGGLHVFPVWGIRERGGKHACACPEGATCGEAGKHPLVKWKEESTNDGEKIKEWWGKWPEANIGLALAGSGLLVLDTDQDEDEDGAVRDGADTLEVWRQDVGLPDEWLGDVPRAVTGGGGRHLFWQDPGGIKNIIRWIPMVDVKSVGGYVLLAPSRHLSGNTYTWSPGGAEQAPGLLAPVVTETLRTARGDTKKTTPDGAAQPAGYDFHAAKSLGPPRGHRDDFFNRYGFQLRRDGWSIDPALRVLRDLWTKTPQEPDGRISFTWETVERKTRNIWGEVEPDEDKKAENVVELAGWAARQQQRVVVSGQLAEQPAPVAVIVPAGSSDPRESLSDYGAALRFAEVNAPWHRYTPGLGWFAWNGWYWEPDSEGARVLADGWARFLPSEEAWLTTHHGFGSEEEIKRRERYRETLFRANTQKQILGLAQAQRVMRVEDPDGWDPDPWLLVVLNGVLDLRTFELRDPSPQDLCTRTCSVHWEGIDALAPLFMSHLNWMTSRKDGTPDEMEAESLLRCLGYALTGSVQEQVAVLLVGNGRNGKSVLCDVVARVLGGYAWQIPVKTLVGKDDDNAFELAALRGVRFAHGPELPEKGVNVDRFKRLSGEGRMTARRMYKEAVEFRLQAKLFLHGNALPRVTKSAGKSDAYWRRLFALFCERQVPVDEVVLNLDQMMLEMEGPGILAALARGCQRWQESGLLKTDRATGVVTEYREEENPMAGFLELLCESSLKTEERIWIPRSLLLGWYQEESRIAGERAMAESELKGLMEALGYIQTHPRRFVVGESEKVRSDRGWHLPPLLDASQRIWRMR